MRFVDRSEVNPIPESLISPVGKTQAERLLAEAYYSGVGPIQKAFEFKEYKNADVIQSLDSIFFKKCAYCESYYGATQSVDIEHYRPKGGIVEDPNHYGYWWLALEWENLLPSCIDCNRRRGQVFESSNALLNSLNNKGQISGKGNYFPIKGVRACTKLDDIKNEDPLLINPTEKNPDDHLVWILNGKISVVAPVNINSIDDEYGSASIKIYGLNRSGLCEARQKLLYEMQTLVIHIETHLNKATTVDGEFRDFLITEAKNFIEELRTFTSKEKPYSALAKAFFNKTISDLLNTYSELLSSI